MTLLSPASLLGEPSPVALKPPKMLHIVVARFRVAGQPDPALGPAFSAHLEQPFLPIKLAGPLLDAEGVQTGVFMLIETETRSQVEHVVRESPFSAAHLYESVSIDQISLEVGTLP